MTTYPVEKQHRKDVVSTWSRRFDEVPEESFSKNSVHKVPIMILSYSVFLKLIPEPLVVRGGCLGGTREVFGQVYILISPLRCDARLLGQLKSGGGLRVRVTCRFAKWYGEKKFENH